MVPVDTTDNVVTMGCLAVPADPSLKKELSFITGKEIVFKEVSQEEFVEYFEEVFGEAFGLKNGTSTTSNNSSSIKDLSNGPVVQQVNTIIHEAINMKASDVHIEPYEKEVRVRYRLDGVLQHIGNISLIHKDAVISRIKIMADLDIAEKRRPQDGRIRLRKEQQDIDLRISTLPTDHGEKVVLRILDKNNQRLSLKDLGFGSDNLNQFNNAIHQPYGMILVTGPTGSGKTTTLYAALNELNTAEVNITTIEDPIEYNLHGINQTHVRGEIGLTFSHVLRSILRQDPDIIMVGEIRDLETAKIAIRAALTGHLVFATLHTNDAPSAITRLADMGIEPFLVASSVQLVMAQRLVRRICSNCKKQSRRNDKLLMDLGIADMEAFHEGEGCEYCSGTGFKGRTALFEIMPVTDSITSQITKNVGGNGIKKQAVAQGMTTLREAGIQKIKDGITTPEEVYRETVT